MLFVVGLPSLFRVTPRMNHVRPRYVSVVRRLLVLSAFVVLCCFTMVTRSVGKMFLDLLVVFGSFFRHCSFPSRVCVNGDRYFSRSDSVARQNSDGNVSAKLNRPSTNTAANAAISVMGQ